jgi:hypothetical protein
MSQDCFGHHEQVTNIMGMFEIKQRDKIMIETREETASHVQSA